MPHGDTCRCPLCEMAGVNGFSKSLDDQYLALNKQVEEADEAYKRAFAFYAAATQRLRELESERYKVWRQLAADPALKTS